ncbi:MAG: peptidylprolyl isomerase [Flavisolibacter sp.]
MKRLLAIGFALSTLASSAQTLFSYGKENVTVPEFLRAYQRNKTGPNDEAALRSYLDLYVAARLKIKEAHTLHIDTLPQIRADLAALRQQVAGSYLIAPARVQQLVDEAFDRMQTERRLQHIYISFGNGSATAMEKASDKRDDVVAALKKGTSFSDIARVLSDDPSAKENGGELGWITAFSLPYALENLAYQTKVGQVSDVFTSIAGYHFIKPVEERKSQGRVKVAQILLAFPPNATDDQKTMIGKQADSLYKVLKSGGEFAQLATVFSNDLVSAANHGEMPEFGTGQYDLVFEKTAFALKPQEVSKPLELSDGYHLIKLLQKTPPPQRKQDAATREKIYQMVEENGRMEYLKDELAENILKEHSHSPAAMPAGLQAFTDSVVDQRPTHAALNLNDASLLLQVENEKSTVADWIEFVKETRASGNNPSLPKLWHDYRRQKAFDYYIANLEKFNNDFRQQMKEFEEGNLFFEIMQQHVWTPAQKDTTGQRKFYNSHKERYQWQKSADAVVFFAPDEASAKTFRADLEKAQGNWQAVLQNHPEIGSDASRFDWEHIPGSDKSAFEAATITPVKVNAEDNTASFALIEKTYPQPEQKTFEQARAEVINDYQAEVEKEWVAALRKKYPVKINQKVWEDVVENGKWK